MYNPAADLYTETKNIGKRERLKRVQTGLFLTGRKRPVHCHDLRQSKSWLIVREEPTSVGSIETEQISLYRRLYSTKHSGKPVTTGIFFSSLNTEH